MDFDYIDPIDFFLFEETTREKEDKDDFDDWDDDDDNDDDD